MEYRACILKVVFQSLLWYFFILDISSADNARFQFQRQIPNKIGFITNKFPTELPYFFCPHKHFTLRRKASLESIFGEVKTALVPEDLDDVVALFSAETIANLIGGFSSKEVGRLLQNFEKGLITKLASSEAILAAESVFVPSIRLGLYRPTLTLLVFFSSSFVSLSTKYIGRKVTEDEENEEQNVQAINIQAVLEDMMKWLAYDGLIQSLSINRDDSFGLSSYFIFGMMASLVASLIKSTYSNSGSQDCWKNSLEDGILFLLYEFFAERLAEAFPQFSSW